MNLSQQWNMHKNTLLTRSAYLVASFLLVLITQTTIANNNLPDIGGPGSAELSISKEIELGEILIKEIRGNLPVSNDPELS